MADHLERCATCWQWRPVAGESGRCALWDQARARSDVCLVWSAIEPLQAFQADSQ